MSLNPLEMPIRAENMSLEILLKVRDVIREFGLPPVRRQIDNLIDFFSHEVYYRRFQQGLKGWGKTFSVLIALNHMVEKKPGFKPLMLIFDPHKGILMYNPLRFASKEAWGERLEFYHRSFDEIFERASCIIIDDIHYIFEYLAENASFFPSFLKLLEKVYEKSLERTKILLISEEPLFSYAELFDNEKLDSLITKFGLIPKTFLDEGSRKLAWKWQLDPYAFREIAYFTFKDWVQYLAVYKGFEIQSFAAQTLFNIEKSPRGLVKISKLFKNRITDEAFFKLTMERLREQGVEPEEIKAYEMLYRTVPVLDRYEIEKFAIFEDFQNYQDKYGIKDRGLIRKSLEYISKRLLEDYEELRVRTRWIPPTDVYNPRLGKKIHRNGYWRETRHMNIPLYVLRRGLKVLGHIELSLLIRKYLLEEFKNLGVSIKDLTSDLLALASLNMPVRKLLKFLRGEPPSISAFKQTVNRLRLTERQVLKLYRNGILYIPFEKAFGHYLRERPSTEIISRKLFGKRRKAGKGLPGWYIDRYNGITKEAWQAYKEDQLNLRDV